MRGGLRGSAACPHCCTGRHSLAALLQHGGPMRSRTLQCNVAHAARRAPRHPTPCPRAALSALSAQQLRIMPRTLGQAGAVREHACAPIPLQHACLPPVGQMYAEATSRRRGNSCVRATGQGCIQSRAAGTLQGLARARQGEARRRWPGARARALSRLAALQSLGCQLALDMATVAPSQARIQLAALRPSRR